MADINLKELLQGQGDLDLELNRLKLDDQDFFRDKLVFLIVAHEIGHTLGLNHNDDDACLMTSNPSGHAKMCKREILAAKTKLEF